MDLFNDYLGIGFVSLGYTGIDAQIRRGIYSFRGPSRKWLFRDLGWETALLEEMLAGAPHLLCHGVIGHITNPEQIRLLKDAQLPIINLARSESPEAWNSHRISMESVGRMAAEYFLSLGHRHLVLASPPPGQADFDVWEGFQAAALAQGVELLAWLRSSANQREVYELLPSRSTYPISTMTEWLLQAPKPVALLCSSDQTALRYTDFCMFQGLNVPEDVAILGIGDVEEVCMMNHVPLSSIALPGEKLGALAAEELERRMKGEASMEPHLLGAERVVLRRSTDQLAMKDPVIAEMLARLHRYAAERMSIADMCKGLPLCRRSINERFQAAMGRSIREELFRIRVDLAKERLLSTDQTVFQVALECGFVDPESMAKHFKSLLGCTPSQFRKDGARA